MFILAIIAFVLTQVCGAIWLYNYQKPDSYGGGLGWGIGYWTLGVIWLIAFLVSLNISFTNQNLTGYIYASQSTFGYTTAHIRFSQSAGQDVQPSFCVKTDSPVGQQIQRLAGSGQKVRVDIPRYFYFANNPFACGTTKMTITKL